MIDAIRVVLSNAGMRIVELGELRVRLAGGTDREGGGDGPVVVLLHGFGAPGDDLVSLWRALGVPAGTRFAFPEAPVSLEPFGYGSGRAWWMIDMDRLVELQRGRPADAVRLRKDVPPGLADARAKVTAMLGALVKELAPSRVVLGGFSQGAMLSVDVALHADVELAGLVLMSGTIVAEDEWEPLFAKRRGLPVVQSHGEADPLLPYANAEVLREKMTAAGWGVTFLQFRGGHEIPTRVVDGVSAFLGRVLA
jgi:phospholipase/carboxylesterase